MAYLLLKLNTNLTVIAQFNEFWCWFLQNLFSIPIFKIPSETNVDTVIVFITLLECHYLVIQHIQRKTIITYRMF